MALGLAAMNTGNNLLYLLVSMLLGVIIVSGVLSEQSMRGLHFTAVGPAEIYSGRPTLFGLRVANRKRRRASYSLTLEILDGAGGPPIARAHLPRVEPESGELVTWETGAPGRGQHPFPRLRVSTRFPFALFVKAGQVELQAELIVFPAVRAVSRDAQRALGGAGTGARRRGRGSDLYNLRDYRSGDDPRLIHWRTSARAGTLTVRELEADAAMDVRIVLDGTGADAERLEAGLSEAASIASQVIDAGAGVELSGPGLLVPFGRGRAHRRELLTALALYDPAADASRADAARRVRLGERREIRVPIG
jgi:uncharacterized protein (DUF58 family)